MNIFYSDEVNKLSSEILDLMQKAGEISLENEFGEELRAHGFDVSDIPVDVSLTIADPDMIQDANRQFRGIDKVTDVLSFPQYEDREAVLDELIDLGGSGFESDDVMGALLGDVVICYDRAAEQAEEYGTGLKRELVYLFVHSMFHLLGYDHMEEDEKKVMRQREEAVMEVVGL